MQIFVDTQADSVGEMREAAFMLLALADERDPSKDEPAPTVEAMRADAGHASEAPAVLPVETALSDSELAAAAFSKVDGAATAARAAFAPMPPPVNAVPPPPPAPPSEPVADVTTGGTAPELDADGWPHDTRIHSATPTRKSDGRWRARRGLDHATLVTVEAELRAKGYGVPPPPAATVSLPSPPAADSAAPVQQVTVPAAPDVPPPPPGAAAVLPGNGAGVTFIQLMNLINGHTGNDGRLSAERMKPVHAKYGAASWADYCLKCKEHLASVAADVRGMLS